MEKVEEFIDSIDDPLIAHIFNLRYIKDMSWIKISLKLGGGNTEDGVRKMHDRFLKRKCE